MKVGTDLPRLYFIYRDNGKIKFEWSFEPTGIQIDGQLKLDEFEQWEASWHKLLEETEFPYKYEDDPNFSY